MRCNLIHPDSDEPCILSGPHVDHVAASGGLWTDEKAVEEIRAKFANKSQGTKKEAQGKAKNLASRLKNLDQN